MAVFRHERDYQRLDYKLLRENTVSLYLNIEILAKDIVWLEAKDYLIISFNCSQWNDELEMHKDFSEKLNLPEYYGENLDALNDCINGIEISDKGGQVLVFYHFDLFANKFSKVAWNILDIIEGQSRFYILNGKRFLALIHSNDQAIKFAPFGCHSPRLSPSER